MSIALRLGFGCSHGIARVRCPSAIRDHYFVMKTGCERIGSRDMFLDVAKHEGVVGMVLWFRMTDADPLAGDTNTETQQVVGCHGRVHGLLPRHSALQRDRLHPCSHSGDGGHGNSLAPDHVEARVLGRYSNPAELPRRGAAAARRLRDGRPVVGQGEAM